MTQINRGTLLRWMASSASNDALKKTAPLLGYYSPDDNVLRRDELLSLLPPQSHARVSDKNEKTAKASSEHKPLPNVTHYYLAQSYRYARDEAVNDRLPLFLEETSSFQDDELEGFWSDTTPVAQRSLCQKTAYAEFIQQRLQQVSGWQLDLPQLIRVMAKKQPLKQLPKCPRVRPAAQVIVIVDRDARLLPFWPDTDDLCRLIRKQFGRVGLDIRMLAGRLPREGYYRFDAWEKKNLQQMPWQPIPALSQVIILSDLGQASWKGKTVSRYVSTGWKHFLRQLKRRGIKPLVIAPMAAVEQDKEVKALAQQHLWQRHSTPQDITVHSQQAIAAYRREVEAMLPWFSLSPHIELSLLREICHTLGVNVEIEAGIFQHPHVDSGLYLIGICDDKRAHYRQQLYEYQRQQPEMYTKVLALLERHQKPQFPAVWSETLLNAKAVNLPHHNDMPRAEEFMQRVAKRFYEEQQHGGIKGYVKGALDRLADEEKHTNYASTLYALAYKDEIANQTPIPEGYNTETIQRLVSETTEQRPYHLRQRGDQLEIALKTAEDPVAGQTLVSFTTRQRHLLINRQQYALPTPSQPLRLRLQKEPVEIDTGQQHFRLEPMEKPSWASAFWVTEGRPYAGIRRGDAAAELTLPLSKEEAWLGQVPWLKQYGDEAIGSDEYGLYHDLTIKGVTQRFRYIEPGTFKMGSPEDEREREPLAEELNIKETQHAVTLTQGYWLADTACTQALWQAVMGENPARFSDDDQHPVEQVSWLDCQQLIEKLNQTHPDLDLQLPTEAQWEYACRAGTTTPFSWGETVTTDQVNYDGNYPYGKGKEGEYRETTVPVKALPANEWGLYQMHGNVWEWCDDLLVEDLGSAPMIDPTQGEDKPREDVEALRVLRGGSWVNVAHLCRSASRIRFTADGRSYGIGFRLSSGHGGSHQQKGEWNDPAGGSEPPVQPTEQAEQALVDEKVASGVEKSTLKNWAKAVLDGLKRK